MSKTYNAYLDGVLIASNLSAPDYTYLELNENVLYRVTFTQVLDGLESGHTEALDVRTLRLPITITYDLSGGTGTFPNQDSRRGSILVLHSARPTRTGHVFINWRGSNGVNYDPGQQIIGQDSITLTAQWVAQRVVSYNLDGGTGSFPTQTLVEGTTFTIPTNTPSKTHHTFRYWTFNGVQYQPGQEVVVGSTDITFTAFFEYTAPSYTLTYALNGGTGSYTNVTVVTGTEVTISSTAPTRSGYRFIHWKGSNGTNYAPGAKFALTSDVTITAQWVQTVTATYALNGGTGSFTNHSVDVGTEITLSMNIPTRTGYRFRHWTGSNGVNYAPGAKFQLNANLTLTAHWIQQFTLTFALNSGSGSFPSQTVDTGTVITLSATAPTRSGYRFTGWSGSNGTTYQVSGKVTMNSNITLTAQWVQRFTLTYALNGGSGSFTNTTVDKGASVTISSTAPTRSGYRFVQWNGSNGVNYSPGVSITMNANVTITAQWVQRFSMSYDLAGGSPSQATVTYDTGATHTFPTNVTYTKASNRFNWWTIGGTRAGATVVMNGNKSAVASWIALTQTKTVDVTAHTNANTVFRLTVTRTGISGAPNAMVSTFTCVLTIHRLDSWNGQAFWSNGGTYSIYLDGASKGSTTKNVDFTVTSSVRQMEIARWTVTKAHGARAALLGATFKFRYDPPANTAHTVKEGSVTFSNI